MGLLACGVCVGVGPLIGDYFHIGIWGAIPCGGFGGFLFSQLAIRSTLEVVRERHRLREPVSITTNQ